MPKRYDSHMIFRPTHQNRTWHRLTCLLLVLAMVVAPMISTLADQHESQHFEMSDHHHGDHGSTDQQVVEQDSNTDESSLLHNLAHASHCCGLAIAVLPNVISLNLPPTASTLSVSTAPSYIVSQSLSHFRPPIFL